MPTNASLSSVDVDDLATVHGGTNFVAGDSIALGVAQQLHWQHNAKVGAPSSNIIGRVPQGSHFHYVVLSAGSNDPMNPSLASNLNTMRRRVGGGVVWIEPVNAHARAVVDRVAHAHGDRVVSFTPGPDHVHPRSYAQLADRIRQITH